MEMLNTKRILIQIEKSSKPGHTKMTENKTKRNKKQKVIEWNGMRKEVRNRKS
jgi:hypothetical protein